MHCCTLASVVTSVLALVAHTATVKASSPTCQMDTVKMHAYHACDYVADQLHEDHYRVTTRSRKRRSARTLEPTLSEDADITLTERNHDFKHRYNRPTHLSIRHLTDAYLVMDYPYAKILRKHSSRRYKIMPSHFYNQNGTLERVPHHEEETLASSEGASSEVHQPHHHRYRLHHRHHPHGPTVATSDDSISESTEDSNQTDNFIRRRSSRSIHVAMSACCRDIEKCIHTMCPMRR